MKSLALKSIVIAAAFAATSAFGAEIAPPFEKTQFDRGLYGLSSVPPRIATQPAADRVFVAGPEQASGARDTDASQASAGASAIAARSHFATGVWANDPHFIAPPQ